MDRLIDNTSKIGSVGGHHDEGEEPLHDGHCPSRYCSRERLSDVHINDHDLLRQDVASLTQKRSNSKP